MNLKLNKDECYFRCTSVHSLVKYYPGMAYNLATKAKSAYRDASFKEKKELQAFLGIIYYVG